MGTIEEMIKKIRQLEAGEDSEPPTADATEEPPPKRKPGVEKASKKQKPITTCVVCWPEEDNKLSLVPAKKIVSPAQDDFAPDTFCKVKGFESHLCKMVAVGTETDMKKKIRELEANDDAEEASSPPKKKSRVEKAPKGRKGLGKENRKNKHNISGKEEGREERQRCHCCSSTIREHYLSHSQSVHNPPSKEHQCHSPPSGDH